MSSIAKLGMLAYVSLVFSCALPVEVRSQEKKSASDSLAALRMKSQGDAYLRKGDTMRAATYYEQALVLIPAAHDKNAEAEIYASQAIIRPGDRRRVIALRLKAKALWDPFPPENRLVAVNAGMLGKAYLDLVRGDQWEKIPPSDTMPHDRQKLLAIGEGYLRTAIALLHGNSHVKDSAYFTGVLAELEEQKGDFRNAYYHFRACRNITDSIYSLESKILLAKMEDARETERKSHELANSELQIANRNKKWWLVASCIALLVVSGGLVYRITR